MYNNDEYIYIIKAFAIFSVVCAHVTQINLSNELFKNFSLILSNIGSLGVGIFYIFAGYFFSENKKSFYLFMKRKVNKILVPWIFTGTLVYLYVTIRKGNINLYSWALWIIGYKTYLYFLSNLYFFYIYFFIFKISKLNILIAIFLGILSINMSAYNYLNLFNFYLNPFNFIIYFSIGIYIKRNIKIENLKYLTNKYKLLTIILYIIISIISQKFDLSGGYFGKLTLILQLLSFFSILGFCQVKAFNNNYIIDLGKKSFTIYLIHMPIAGVIVYLFNKIIFLQYLILLRPFIVLFLTKLVIDIYIKILQKVNLKNRFGILIGV